MSDNPPTDLPDDASPAEIVENDPALRAVSDGDDEDAGTDEDARIPAADS